jgi:D-beta-D-heptose 7-phosphate kinase/D-beta-D-heptose 1-phosphate adenosyltransferase
MATKPHVVVVGDALLDRDVDGQAERLAPDAPVPVIDSPELRSRPGGAALAAALAASDAAQVHLVTALADDRAGRTLRRLLDEAGVSVHDLGLQGSTPEKVRVCAQGRPVVRVDIGGEPGRVGAATDETSRLLARADAVLVADYGRGVAAKRSVRSLLERSAERIPLVWDPHPRGPHPVTAARLATPNREELAQFAPGEGHLTALTRRGEELRRRWRAANLAVTLGERGALLLDGEGAPLVVPPPRVSSGDPCGAGDRFAARAAAALADGALPSEAVTEAVAAAASFIAAGGAAAYRVGRSPDRRPDTRGIGAADLAHSVRAEGGTVVATGGCFDLLHAGHVRMLEAARALGDCLVVCLNSDASVRRLKGPERPLVPQHDRAAVLLGLACVDAVTIFDEDTPETALRRIRPHVWAKGGDYRVTDLPEARVLGEWDGQAVVLPFVPGRSTTTLIQEARRRAHV